MPLSSSGSEAPGSCPRASLGGRGTYCGGVRRIQPTTLVSICHRPRHRLDVEPLGTRAPELMHVGMLNHVRGEIIAMLTMGGGCSRCICMTHNELIAKPRFAAQNLVSVKTITIATPAWSQQIEGRLQRWRCTVTRGVPAQPVIITFPPTRPSFREPRTRGPIGVSGAAGRRQRAAWWKLPAGRICQQTSSQCAATPHMHCAAQARPSMHM